MIYSLTRCTLPPRKVGRVFRDEAFAQLCRVTLLRVITESFPEPESDNLSDSEPGEDDIAKMGFGLGGLIGIDPRPFTLRQLSYMVKAAELANWAKCAQLCHASTLAMCGKAIPPQDFMPGWVRKELGAYVKHKAPKAVVEELCASLRGFYGEKSSRH